eukprot:TRINITY_DN3980_c0_g1_i1.p1 TRINITY_DN3980_c0_g1~~TRINITY_DN3980_c0_g1_i1.p1  ORF type:complete len:751 (-),score=160.25 TRINITY_DN3980_c0_g1_i1:386-2638(-)
MRYRGSLKQASIVICLMAYCTSRSLRHRARATTYDESFLEELEYQPKRKKKRYDSAKENEIEKMIASSIGFLEDDLTAEETAAGLGGEDRLKYVEVRNHIIARWRENVHDWLSRSEVMESIKKEHRNIVDAAYDFLLAHGYINFGVAPAIRAQIPLEATKANVVIIGAGFSGLAAAMQLKALGFKVAIIEGRPRPGGRVYTEKLTGNNQVAAAELGGSVITGIHANPLAVLSRQLGLPLHKIREKCPLYRTDGSCVDAEPDDRMFKKFEKLLDKTNQLRKLMGESAANISLGATLETLRHFYGVATSEEESQLLNWHFANLEYANAALLSDLSLAFWDQDDPYEMGGDHCWLAGGNCRLINTLAENFPIFYGRVVNEIVYGGGNGVQVIAGGQVFLADMALCTVSLGVLKSNSIKFVPSLPKRKIGAIQRLGFGLLNKVAMLFPYAFWEKNIDTFGCLNSDTSRRGEFVFFYSYASVSGGPVLVGLVAGEAAARFEKMAPEDIVHRVLSVLKGIYTKKGITVPDPIQTVCTRWGSDPLSLGSYSYVAIGASGKDYDILAESVGDGRLFFAGEATTSMYPATMHGAFLSGLREAAKISKVAENQQLNREKRASKDNAIILDNLFKEPDLQFGWFSVLFDPTSSDPTSNVLLRVLIEGPKPTASKDRICEVSSSSRNGRKYQAELTEQLKLYAVMQRQEALALSEVEGGDETRLLCLCQKFGVKLVGRRALGKLGDSLVLSIKSAKNSYRRT